MSVGHRGVSYNVKAGNRPKGSMWPQSFKFMAAGGILILSCYLIIKPTYREVAMRDAERQVHKLHSAMSQSADSSELDESK